MSEQQRQDMNVEADQQQEQEQKDTSEEEDTANATPRISDFARAPSIATKRAEKQTSDQQGHTAAQQPDGERILWTWLPCSKAKQRCAPLQTSLVSILVTGGWSCLTLDQVV